MRLVVLHKAFFVAISKVTVLLDAAHQVVVLGCRVVVVVDSILHLVAQVILSSKRCAQFLAIFSNFALKSLALLFVNLLLTLGCFLHQLTLLFLISHVFSLLALLSHFKLAFDLLTHFIFINLTSRCNTIEVKPAHVRVDGSCGKVGYVVLNLENYVAKFVLLLIHVRLMVVFYCIKGVNIFFTILNNFLLDLHIEVVQVVGISVKLAALVLNERILSLEDLSVIVVQIKTKIFLAVLDLSIVVRRPLAFQHVDDNQHA